MKILKKVLSVSLSVGVLTGCFALNVPGALAASKNVENNIANQGNIADQGFIDLSDMKKMKKNSPNITITEVTYDEMIDKIAESEGISVSQARTETPREISSGIGIRTIEEFHEIKVRQTVTSSYKPALQLFVRTYSSGSFHEYQKIKKVTMDRRHMSLSNGVSKQFSGDIDAQIYGPQKIWWHINGDFYNNGTTTITGSVKAGGAIWEGSGSVSSAKNHYKYYNKTGNVY